MCFRKSSTLILMLKQRCSRIKSTSSVTQNHLNCAARGLREIGCTHSFRTTIYRHLDSLWLFTRHLTSFIIFSLFVRQAHCVHKDISWNFGSNLIQFRHFTIERSNPIYETTFLIEFSSNERFAHRTVASYLPYTCYTSIHLLVYQRL